MFRGPRQSRRVKIVKISGGRGGSGGSGGANGGSGGAGEGPRVKILSARTVTNINKNYSAAPAVPSGFRTIALGDIDLQREIQLDMVSGVVSRRKLHSAKLLGDRERSDVTVAVYQGAGAKQEWRRDIARYRAIRHPNIVQLYGTVSCGDIHAAVFHDGSARDLQSVILKLVLELDLIPFQQFLNLYRHSHFSRAYIHVYMCAEFEAVEDYFKTAFKRSLNHKECTFFIRRSTGRLCVDLVAGGVYLKYYNDIDQLALRQGLKLLAQDNSEAIIIDSLTLDQYHLTCYFDFPVNQFWSLPPSETVNLGSILNCPEDNTFDHYLVEIAWLPSIELLSNANFKRWVEFWRANGGWVDPSQAK